MSNLTVSWYYSCCSRPDPGTNRVWFRQLLLIQILAGRMPAEVQARMKKDAKIVYVDVRTQRFRGGLEFKAYKLVHHSTLGLRVIKKEGDRAVFDTCMVYARTQDAAGGAGAHGHRSENRIRRRAHPARV